MVIVGYIEEEEIHGGLGWRERIVPVMSPEVVYVVDVSHDSLLGGLVVFAGVLCGEQRKLVGVEVAVADEGKRAFKGACAVVAADAEFTLCRHGGMN